MLLQISSVSFSLSFSLFFTAFFDSHTYVLSTGKLSVSQLVGWVGFSIEKTQSKKRHL